MEKIESIIFPQQYSRLFIHPDFTATIKDLSKIKQIKFEESSNKEKFDFNFSQDPTSGVKISTIENFKTRALDSKNGERIAQSGYVLSAYDESYVKYNALAGLGILTSHSLIIHGKDDYLSSNNLTFYFYTRSSDIAKESEFIKKTTEIDSDISRDYALDRLKFITENAPSNSIIFIDGPLIGGQITSYTLKMNNKLLERNIIPIFFVKNSSSNLITDNIVELKGKFNSDMHWASTSLCIGQRSNFFKYQDENNRENNKIFCYFKTFDVSPQRVEFHTTTFKKFSDVIDEIMDLIYYLMLVQGDPRNPQIRPIAIAEKFARETLKVFDMFKIMRDLGLTPTMNQERFG